ncbi:MAG: hypothetical protein AAGK14_12295 [Verrucomicrobiota bacterium]
MSAAKFRRRMRNRRRRGRVRLFRQVQRTAKRYALVYRVAIGVVVLGTFLAALTVHSGPYPFVASATVYTHYETFNFAWILAVSGLAMVALGVVVLLITAFVHVFSAMLSR